jgi:phospholipase D1/2
MSENTISHVKKGANVVIKPFSVLTSGSLPANNTFKPKKGDHERQDFDNNGERTQGFASSVVPTLEEKTISEQQPVQKPGEGRDVMQGIEEATVPEEANPKDSPIPVDHDKDNGNDSSAAKIRPLKGKHEKYGKPANAVEDDNELPNEGTHRSEENSTDAEKAAVKARQTIRKHMGADVDDSPVRRIGLSESRERRPILTFAPFGRPILM